MALLFVLGFVLAAPTDGLAQLVAARDGPIVYGHHHLNVTSAEEHKKFWITALGGTEGKFGNTDIIKVRNALIFLAVRKPSAGSKGSTVDHLAFSVPNLRAAVDRLKAGGFRLVTAAEAPANIQVKDDIGLVPGDGPVTGLAYVLAPDDVKVELLEMRAQDVPIASHHIHFTGPQQEMHAWYMKTFGAAAGTSANPQAFISATLPGLVMNFTSAQGTAPTRGRAVDHIGFEVKGLEAFVKRLEASGMKLDVAYRSVPAAGIAIAFITDPWGTYIELTEGLATIN